MKTVTIERPYADLKLDEYIDEVLDLFYKVEQDENLTDEDWEKFVYDAHEVFGSEIRRWKRAGIA